MVNRKSVIFICAMMSPFVGNAQTNDAAADSSVKKSWELKTGLAYDSNIYRAPSDPYFDAAAAQAVTPNVQSGLFIPIRVKGDFSMPSDKDNAFVGDMTLNYDKYISSDYSNADKTRFILKLGYDHVLSRKNSRERKLYGGIKFKKAVESYLDRDTGDEKFNGARDISDRYQYTQTGIEFDYKSRVTEPQYKFGMDYYDRKYKEVLGATEYDYSYYRLDGEVKFRLARYTKLRVGYDHYEYKYKYRSARNLADGTLNTNVRRHYAYDKFSANLRHRIKKGMVAHLDYEFKLRTDKFEGYNDYTKNKIRAEFKYDLDDKQAIKFDTAYWKRDYPNAFAFDLVGQSQKKYQGTKTRLNYSYQWDKAKTLLAQLDHWNENSSDTRYQFDRTILWLGIEWQL